jgi:hypothetical protein
MSSTVLLLEDVKNKMLISFGIIFIVLGTMGNTFNIILFGKRSLWTVSPCVAFLMADSIVDMINTYIFLLFQMLIGFNITPDYYSSVFCKIKVYLYYSSSSLSNWFMAACCLDRFLSSSTNVNIRSYSSMRIATRTIPAIVTVVLVAHLPFLYCYEANQFTQFAPCYMTNAACTVFDTTCYFIFQGITPSMFMLAFGIGTFIHIHQGRKVRQEPLSRGGIQIGMDLTTNTARNATKNGREILLMLAIQVTLCFICLTPLLAMKIYSNIPVLSVKSDVRIAIENLFLNISILFSFVDKMFSFYIYTLSSKFYRKELIKLIKRCLPQRQVAPQN